MKLLITGDFVINQPYNTPQISEEVKELFAQSDYNIVNLEAPVTNSESKIIKTGPHLKADKKSTLEVLKSLKVNLCTLANNHVLDYDEQGVLDTLNFCKENNIETVGAGKNKEEAAKVFYLDSEVGKIAFINIAENEWASATETTAGANGMDLIDDVKIIQESKQQNDFVFVIVHGGHLFYNIPSPRMQKQYRFYIDNGADMVVGHHTHCLGGFEKYKGKNIFYSLGNFIFTKRLKPSNSKYGLILEIDISPFKSITTNIHPIKIDKEQFNTIYLKNEEQEKILIELDAINNNIADPQIIKKSWQVHIEKTNKMYLNNISPMAGIRNKYLKWLLIKLGVKLINKKSAASLLNNINCESHLDVSRDSLRKYIYGK